MRSRAEYTIIDVARLSAFAYVHWNENRDVRAYTKVINFAKRRRPIANSFRDFAGF